MGATRSGRKCRVTTAVVALVTLISLAPWARAGTNRVVADSLGTSAIDPAIIPWPTLAFGENVVTSAYGGASSFDFIDLCSEGEACAWASGDPDDVWWILIGHNDYGDVPDWKPEDYETNILTLAAIIETRTGADDIRLLSSPHQLDGPGRDLSADRARSDAQAAIDLALCTIDPRFSCVADLRSLALDPANYGRDGVHFSQRGHEAVAAMIVPEPSTAVLVLCGLLGIARRRVFG